MMYRSGECKGVRGSECPDDVHVACRPHLEFNIGKPPRQVLASQFSYLAGTTIQPTVNTHATACVLQINGPNSGILLLPWWPCV